MSSPVLEIDASARHLTLTFDDDRVTRYTVKRGALWEFLSGVSEREGHKALKSALLKGKAGWIGLRWMSYETLQEPTPYAERIAAGLKIPYPELIAKLKESLRDEPADLALVPEIEEEWAAGEVDG